VAAATFHGAQMRGQDPLAIVGMNERCEGRERRRGGRREVAERRKSVSAEAHGVRR
jgi:hypothetical protein